MKKYLLIVTVIAFGLSLAACSGNKGGNATDDATKQEKVTTVTEPNDDGDVLAKYETIVDKLIALQEKVLSGDEAAVQESAKLTEQMGAIAVELQNTLTDLTPEQVQKFTEIGQKWAEAASKAVQ